MIKGSFDDPSSGNIMATIKVDIQDSKKCSLSLIFNENQQIVMYPKFGMIFVILRKYFLNLNLQEPIRTGYLVKELVFCLEKTKNWLQFRIIVVFLHL
jgi:hypothetical protein